MNAVLNRTTEKPEPAAEAVPRTIRETIAQAADIVAPVWPLTNFIACNPLQGLEDLPFEAAVARAAAYAGIGTAAKDAAAATATCSVNRELIKWCAAFLDEGQATIAMPNRHKGFYATFAGLARFDGDLRVRRDVRAWLGALPERPEDAINSVFNRLGVAPKDQEEFIREALAALPGWSGYVKWRTEWQDAGEGAANPITLLDYVAVRMVITCALRPEKNPLRAARTALHYSVGGMETGESAYRTALLGRLRQNTARIAERAGAKPWSRPEAQIAFCIDVRSEPFRRSLEAQGHYQTLGFAGFFGLPVRVRAYDDDKAHSSCPVLLKPCHEVSEQPAGGDAALIRRHEDGRVLLDLPKSFYQDLKYNFATPFALVEMLGPWYGLRMLARTFAPSLLKRLKRKMQTALMPAVPTSLDLCGMTVASQADYSEGALRTMGLTDGLAPLVVFCGHGSSTSNNAFATALDCGACGGNHGGVNARILAAILNGAEVRALLAARGLPIPLDTLFVAAEHDTTTDEVELYAPETAHGHDTALAKLQSDLAAAADGNRLARCAAFGPALKKPEQARHTTRRRSSDWAEVRPEWGLARNAVFLVGPRELTQGVDLEGRCFLHSYDWARDQDGRFLQTILTAPMVVAQWINCQYLFSTLDNVAWGAGSKVTQNVTGKLGVMQGNASDLMHGLPLQSVYAADDAPYHEPLRLLTVVYAPRRRVHAVIEHSPVLQKLFLNGWVTLVVIDPEEVQSYLLRRDFTWHEAD